MGSGVSYESLKRKEAGLGKKRAHELRNHVFSSGGSSLAKEIIRRFLDIPEVKLLLPDELARKQRNAADTEASEKLQAAAKHFCSVLMKASGSERGRWRLTDLKRNALLQQW